MLLPHDMTIVVTDGKGLRLFRNTGTEFHLALSELPRPDVHGDGRVKKDIQEASFESAVAKWLNHEIASGKLGSLYIIAPPRALGELRLHYSESLKKKLVGELHKEHMNDSIQVLEKVLKDC
jgi:protein required for attachment to host cells